MRPSRVRECAIHVARQSRLIPISTRPFLRLSQPERSYSLRTFAPGPFPRWQSTYSQQEVSQPSQPVLALPVATTIGACPGCGGLAQTVEAGEAGHYSSKRKAVRSYVEYKTGTGNKVDENKVVARSLKNLDPGLRQSIGLDEALNQASQAPEIPYCDRCHELLYHGTGVSILHPSMESIADTIAGSPHKHNHIYHILDAADFPMSLVANVHKILATTLQRSRNRRAKHAGFRYGRQTEISFIITRSDLLAPTKEMVDHLMQYLIRVLRRALGPFAEDVRLGNVRCVSARRGWWIKEVKEDIYRRGGGGWMVGRVNVGKSRLFEEVYPKGRNQDVNLNALRDQSLASRKKDSAYAALPTFDDDKYDEPDTMSAADQHGLLPPARAETAYPLMPTVSSLPGTTASPIRIPFGNGKGELIDLPGLERSTLERFIEIEHRDQLVMKTRIAPEQLSVKPGKSLYLSGLLRITPLTPDTVILAYNFTPLHEHVTSTEKAITRQTSPPKEDNTGPPQILNAKGRESIRSAGRFALRWDVTRQRAGPLTTKAAVGLKPIELPFTVLSTDILIEGVGWIELVAQVRKRKSSAWEENDSHIGLEAEAYPEVEIFTPGGRFVSAREPMGAWLLNATSTKPGQKRMPNRPRRSMASMKRARSAA